MRERPPTSTSYAVLGQLALRSWTMYELAAEMRRNVHFIFARAESQIYEEPKRLVARGLARAETERFGARTRTRYHITAAGQEALRGWLAAPESVGPTLQFEGLLRTLYADQGSAADLRATLARVADEIEPLLETSARVRTEYLDGRAPFQRAVANRVMVYDFLASFAGLVHAWAERSAQAVDRWETLSPEERDAEALRVFERNPPRSPGGESA